MIASQVARELFHVPVEPMLIFRRTQVTRLMFLFHMQIQLVGVEKMLVAEQTWGVSGGFVPHGTGHRTRGGVHMLLQLRRGH
jgi:hypothetical protein